MKGKKKKKTTRPTGIMPQLCLFSESEMLEMSEKPRKKPVDQVPIDRVNDMEWLNWQLLIYYGDRGQGGRELRRMLTRKRPEVPKPKAVYSTRTVAMSSGGLPLPRGSGRLFA